MRINNLFLLLFLFCADTFGQLNQSGGPLFSSVNPQTGSQFSWLKVSSANEAAGVFHSHYLTAGFPGAAAAPAIGVNGTTLTTLAGQIPFTNAGNGKTKYLSKFGATSSIAGHFFVYDLLWHNSGLAVTTLTAQAITSASLPSRDADGASNGAGVTAWLQVYTATTNAAAITTITFSYTNSAGVAGRVGTIPSFPATAVAGTMVPFTLQAGDSGVRSIQSVTFGTSLVTGSVGLVLLRTLAACSITVANTGCELDARFSLVRTFDNSVLFLGLMPTSTTTGVAFGYLAFTEL